MENTRRLLTRNTRDGKLGGVAAGIGDYLGIDPVLVRLAFVLLLFAGGAGAVVYLLAWLIIPAGEPESAPAPADGAAPARSGERDTRWWIGAVLVALGALLLVGLARPWWLDGDVLLEAEIVWPLLLVAAGGALLLWRRNDRGSNDGPRDEPPAPDAGADPAGPADGSADPGDDTPAAGDDSPPGDDTVATGEVSPAADESAAEEPGEVETRVSAASDAADATAEYPTLEQPAHAHAYDVVVPAAPASYPESLPERPARRRRLPVGWITLGAILTSAAVAALLDVTGTLDVPVQWFLAYALGLCGLGIVAAAWYGRIRGPATLAVFTALALLVAAVVEVPLRGGIGGQTVRPASIDELASEYHLGVGRLVLDLRGIALTGPVGRVEAGVSVGELVVLLPSGAVAQVDGRASVGSVELFEHGRGGIHVDESHAGGGAAGAPALLTLDLEVGVGRVEARTAATPPPGGSI